MSPFEPPTMRDAGGLVGTADVLVARHGERLRQLIGRTLDASWVAWDLDADEWFRDEAVVLVFGAARLEIVCWKLSEISVTWNQIDLDAPPAWVADWGDLSAEWRQDGLPELRQVLGVTIRDVQVLEYELTTSNVVTEGAPPDEAQTRRHWLLHGLEFVHDDGSFAIFNALDENGVTLEPRHGEDLRRNPLG